MTSASWGFNGKVCCWLTKVYKNTNQHHPRHSESPVWWPVTLGLQTVQCRPENQDMKQWSAMGAQTDDMVDDLLMYVSFSAGWNGERDGD